MYFSSSATAAVLIAFTTLFSSVHANCIEPPKHKFMSKVPFGSIFRSSKWCKAGEKPDPPFDFKKWASTHTVKRPTGVFGYARPTGTGIFWHNKFGVTGTSGNGRALPTGGVFWHKPGQTGTAVSRMPRPTFTVHHTSMVTSKASTTTSNSRRSFQTPNPRAVEWTG